MRVHFVLVMALALWQSIFIDCRTTSAQERIALLIGNQAYDTSVGILKNPYNDIATVGEALTNQGFEVLPPVKDAKRSAILGAVRGLVRRLNGAGPNAIGFLYYSGHGAAEKATNVNYLIPVDAKSPGTTEFWDESLKLDDVLALLDGARAAAKFVVFDACRNELQLPTKDTSKGFIPVAEQLGMFIAYASKQGQTASDLGDKSGPYSAALAAELAKPGLDHLNLFQNVKETVLATTGGAQQPWESNGLGRRVYLTRRPPAPTFVEPAVAQPQPDSTFGEANGIENALNLTDQERMSVKTALLKRRIDPGRIDTNFDFDARAAIKAWQYTEKRSVTGFLTSPELTELIGPRGQAHTSQDKIAISYFAPPAGADPRLARAIPVLTGYPITYAFIDNHLLIAVAAKMRGGIKFDEARKLAERAGGTLATVESAAKNTAIFNLIKDDPRFWHVDEGGYEGGPWIGLFQTPGSRTSEEGWQWVSGSKTSYRNWDRKSSQPSQIRVGYGPGAAVFGGKFSRPTPKWTDIAIMRWAVPGCIIEIR